MPKPVPNTKKANLKRSIHGTRCHVSRKHLGRHVNEATFRRSEGNCQVDRVDRMAQLVDRMSSKRISYAELTA